MLRPSIFGESLFDDWMDDFPFGKNLRRLCFRRKILFMENMQRT